MLTRAGRPRGAKAFLMTHGAGSGANHPTSLAVEAAVAPLPLRRMEFPYRKAGRRPPDRASALIESIRAEATMLQTKIGCRPAELILGGRSMGGRMCSMAIAEGLPAAGLVLLSYPLHPPGRPDKLRIEHLPRVSVPTLVVSGTKDPFGTPNELVRHLDAITGPITYCWVDGATHDWKNRDDQVAGVVVAWLSGRRVPESLPKPLPRHRGAQTRQ